MKTNKKTKSVAVETEHVKAKHLDNEARCTILETAAHLFAKQGLDGVSTREIAEESRLNISLISYYFGGKLGLYREVIKDFARTIQSRFEENICGLRREKFDKASFRAAVLTMMQSMFRHKWETRHMSAIFMREVLVGLPHSRDVFEETFNGFLVQLVAIFKQAQSQGIMRKEVNPHMVFLSLVYIVDSYMREGSLCGASVDECPKLPEQMDEFIEQIFKIVFEGALV